MKGAKRVRRLSPSKLNIPENTEIVDNIGRKWFFREKIGEGAFGAIFNIDFEKGSKTDVLPAKTKFVIKIEPYENGTLFTECQFFMRAGHINEIQKWKNSRKLDSIGIPYTAGFGVRDINGQKCRFLIIEKFLKCEFRKMNCEQIFDVASMLITPLEYMHSKGFSHHDIKEQNIMLSNKNVPFLIDFGITCRISYDPKPLKTHERNGTLQYMSRDAYIGQLTKRSDIESLFYNLIEWLNGNLPWRNFKVHLSVQEEKIKAFSNIKEFIDKCFKTEGCKNKLIKFGKYLETLNPNDEPDYNLLREILSTKVNKPINETKKVITNGYGDGENNIHKMNLRPRLK